MTKKELMERMREQEEIIQRQRSREKRQNEKAKENWDTVSCRLPKGTRERITDRGLTVNGLINTLVLEYLDGEKKVEKNKK